MIQTGNNLTARVTYIRGLHKNQIITDGRKITAEQAQQMLDDGVRLLLQGKFILKPGNFIEQAEHVMDYFKYVSDCRNDLAHFRNMGNRREARAKAEQERRKREEERAALEAYQKGVYHKLMTLQYMFDQRERQAEIEQLIEEAEFEIAARKMTKKQIIDAEFGGRNHLMSLKKKSLVLRAARSMAHRRYEARRAEQCW